MSWWKPWTWGRTPSSIQLEKQWSRWLPFFTRTPWWSTLDAAERDRLRTITQRYLDAWQFVGCAGLVLDDSMRVVIALQAAYLVLGRRSDDLAHVTEVLLYPSAFRNPLARMNDGGIVSEGTALLGEAWPRGPVILAWDEVLRNLEGEPAGSNLVWHEFAHQLDLEDGVADGRPDIAGTVPQQQWYEVLKPEFEALRADRDRGRRTVLDPYGATNPAEFFAVATESFFSEAPYVEQAYPKLYEVLSAFYGQNPAERERVRKTESGI